VVGHVQSGWQCSGSLVNVQGGWQSIPRHIRVKRKNKQNKTVMTKPQDELPLLTYWRAKTS